MKTHKTISLSAMNSVIRSAGAERVADSAKLELSDALEELGREIARKALTYAQHAKRKTVTGADNRLALKK